MYLERIYGDRLSKEKKKKEQSGETALSLSFWTSCCLLTNVGPCSDGIFALQLRFTSMGKHFTWRVSPMLFWWGIVKKVGEMLCLSFPSIPVLPVNIQFGAEDSQQQDTKIHILAPGHLRDFTKGLIPRYSLFSASYLDGLLQSRHIKVVFDIQSSPKFPKAAHDIFKSSLSEALFLPLIQTLKPGIYASISFWCLCTVFSAWLLDLSSWKWITTSSAVQFLNLRVGRRETQQPKNDNLQESALLK